MYLGLRHRITDRLQLQLHDAPDPSAGGMLRDLDVETERGRLGELVGLAEQPPRAAEFSTQDARQRRALRGVGAFVDVTHGTPAAFVDGAGPFREHGNAERVETHVIDMPVLDRPDPAPLAEATTRPRVEITGTAKVTVARDQHVA